MLASPEGRDNGGGGEAGGFSAQDMGAEGHAGPATGAFGLRPAAYGASENEYAVGRPPVSRGGLYDMGGLVKALDSQKLAGAGVDVTDPEPLPKGHALWKFENAIITPHVAGRSDKDRGRMLGTVRENIRRFGDGRPLLNVVDKQKGY